MTNMKERYRCGDLIAHAFGYDNGRTTYNWCKVLDIVVDNKSYGEYDIITGQGDQNTKVKFLLKPVGKSLDSCSDLKYPIEVISDSTNYWADRPSDIHLIKTEYMEKIYQDLITQANNKMNFIRQHRNRIEKLEELL